MQLKSIKLPCYTTNPEQCNECSLKQKYVSGSNSKCLKHMFQERQKQIYNRQLTKHDEIMNNLQKIQDLLPQYSAQNQSFSYHQSRNQINQIFQQIDKIKGSLQKINDHIVQSQTSLGNFTIHQPFETIGKLSRTPNLSTFDRKQDSVSAFQIQRDLMNQNIKDWVIYFSQKLLFPNQKNRLMDQKILPLEQDFQMKIFKEKMNQKYSDFIKKVDEKNKLLNEAINKLAQYVESDDKKEKRSNSFFDFSSKIRNKMQSSLTPLKGLNLSRTQSGRQTSKSKTKRKQINSFKVNTSSFMIDNVSGIFTTPQVSNQKVQETYFLLISQAQCIEDLLQKSKDDSLLL